MGENGGDDVGIRRTEGRIGRRGPLVAGWRIADVGCARGDLRARLDGGHAQRRRRASSPGSDRARRGGHGRRHSQQPTVCRGRRRLRTASGRRAQKGFPTWGHHGTSMRTYQEHATPGAVSAPTSAPRGRSLARWRRLDAASIGASAPRGAIFLSASLSGPTGTVTSVKPMFSLVKWGKFGGHGTTPGAARRREEEDSERDSRRVRGTQGYSATRSPSDAGLDRGRGDRMSRNPRPDEHGTRTEDRSGAQ